MFARISCPRCHLSSVWTDDPENFLRDVCERPGHCQGEVLHEEFAGASASLGGCVEIPFLQARSSPTSKRG